MAAATKNDRLDLRLTREQKAEIERAAALSGRSVTDFSVGAVLREATEVIRQEHEIAVSRQAFEAFAEQIERPARPLDGLAALLRRPTVFVDPPSA